MDIIGSLAKLADVACKYLCGAWVEDRRTKQQRQFRLACLKEELGENRGIAGTLFPAGGLVTRRFRLDAWDAAKGDVESYPEPLPEKLRAAYGTMHEFNAMADNYEASRDGRLKTVMEIRAGQVRERLEHAQQLLEAINE